MFDRAREEEIGIAVASYVWLRRREEDRRISPGLADEYREELMEKYGITIAAWNAQCVEIAEYAVRQGYDGSGVEFGEAKIWVDPDPDSTLTEDGMVEPPLHMDRPDWRDR